MLGLFLRQANGERLLDHRHHLLRSEIFSARAAQLDRDMGPV